MEALQGWHPGEVAVQRRLGFENAVSDLWRRVGKFMPEQHGLFHSSNLHFIPLTTVDESGCPWASIMAAADGSIGFVKSPTPQTLSIAAHLWDGDPLLDTAVAWSKAKLSGTENSRRFLTAGLGIEFEFSTRRRNKFAGRIQDICPLGIITRFDLNINEAIG